MPKPRKKSKRVVHNILRILCEGEKTEPNYFNGYLLQNHSSNRLLKVVTVEPTNKNTPVQLVEEAIKRMCSPSFNKGDEYWVVYDREAIAKYSDSLHKEARDKANSNGVNIAITNVCFEVWLLLHFKAVTAPYTNCDDVIKTSGLRNLLESVGIKSYDKADASLFEAISDKVNEARCRAEKMNEEALKSAIPGQNAPHNLNPYSDVHKLLDAIDVFVKKAQ